MEFLKFIAIVALIGFVYEILKSLGFWELVGFILFSIFAAAVIALLVSIFGPTFEAAFSITILVCPIVIGLRYLGK